MNNERTLRHLLQLYFIYCNQLLHVVRSLGGGGGGLISHKLSIVSFSSPYHFSFLVILYCIFISFVWQNTCKVCKCKLLPYHNSNVTPPVKRQRTFSFKHEILSPQKEFKVLRMEGNQASNICNTST